MASLVAAISLIAAVADGVPASLSNCELSEVAFERRRSVMVTCALTNTGPRALASYSYAIKTHDEGRALPWEETANIVVKFDGGLEPNETVKASFTALKTVDRSDPSKLIVEVSVAGASEAQ